MECLVVYDVDTTTPEGERRLRRIAKICEGYGIRVQKSVFEITCTSPQFPKLRQQLVDGIDRSRDDIRLYRLSEGTLAGVDRLGVANAAAHCGDHIV